MTFSPAVLAHLRPLLVLAATLAALAGINGFLTVHEVLVGQVLVATVTLAGFFVAARDRKRTDRRRRSEDATLLERLHLEIELSRQHLLLQSAQHSAEALAATQRATEAAQEAFHEANGANNKIAALHRQLD